MLYFLKRTVSFNPGSGVPKGFSRYTAYCCPYADRSYSYYVALHSRILFVPIFSINVIRSVFWGEFYVTNELSHARCLSTTIIILRDSEYFCTCMDYIFRHSGTELCA